MPMCQSLQLISSASLLVATDFQRLDELNLAN
jgi:hypothetical protein